MRKLLLAIALFISLPAAAQNIGSPGNVIGPASSTDGHCALFNGTSGKKLKDGGACPGGSLLTVTDGTNTVTSTTTITTGAGLVVGGSAGSATITPTTPDVTKSADYTVAAGDMGGVINLSGAHTLTIPAISSTVFANGMSSCVSDTGTGNWTVSTTPTLNGFSGTTLYPGSAGCFVSNGTTLDFQPGTQAPTTTRLGGVLALASVSHNFITSISTAGAPAAAQPAVSDISGFGTGVATALGVNVGSAGAPVVNGGALGTPSSGTLTSATGLPVSTGISGLGTNVATALAAGVSGTGNICLASGSACASGGSGSNFAPTAYISGLYYSGLHSIEGGSTVVANRLYAFPFVAGATDTLTKLAVNVTTLAIGGNCELGVYNDAAGIPSTKLVDGGPVTVASLNKRELTGLSISLTAGSHYYAVVGCDNGTVVLTGPLNTDYNISLFNGTDTPGATAEQIYGAWTYAANSLPSTFPTVVHNTGPTPLVWFGK